MATYQGDATGVTPGIVGNTAVGSANGIRATSTSAASALYATATAVGAAALNAAASGPNGYAVYAVTTGTGGTGAYIDANDGTAIRARGGPIAVDAIGTTYGVYAQGVGGIAVWGIGYGGIKGQSSSTLSNAYGVLGEATGSAFAGWFTGRVNVTGQLTKGTGSFLIDHPLDPAGKLLEHSFVESPERKNVYDGVATADAAGEFRVQLPGYFEALNPDFRYQLTAIGGPAPGLHVKHEVVQGVFSVAGAAPGQRVCWQVTGNRKDALALATPLVVEREKPDDERGYYLHPEAFGQPKEKGIAAKRFPEVANPQQPPPPP